METERTNMFLFHFIDKNTLTSIKGIYFIKLHIIVPILVWKCYTWFTKPGCTLHTLKERATISKIRVQPRTRTTATSNSENKVGNTNAKLKMSFLLKNEAKCH